MLWVFETVTRGVEGRFRVDGPIALRALTRWEGREALLVADAPATAIDPFIAEPVSSQLPLPRFLYELTSAIARTTHLQPPTVAVPLTLVLLVPALAFLFAALEEVGHRRTREVALLLLLGPGSFFLSSPGPHVLLLLALSAVLFGLQRRRTFLVASAAVVAALTHPAGLLIAPMCIAGARSDGPRRPSLVAVAMIPLATMAALVAYYLAAGYGPSVAWAPMRHGLGWQGGAVSRIAIAFSGATGGTVRSLDLYAFVATVLLAIGTLAAFASSLSGIRALAVGSLLFLVRDFTDAPSVAAWSIPAAIGWSLILARITMPRWLAVVAALGAFPILFRAMPRIPDWIDEGDGRPVVAGEMAYVATQRPDLGSAKEPRRRLGDRRGTVQVFENGIIYCTPQFACRAVDSAAAARIAAIGGIESCGVPTRDVPDVDDGTRTYVLERGVAKVKPGIFSEAVCGDRRSYSEP